MYFKVLRSLELIALFVIVSLYSLNIQAASNCMIHYVNSNTFEFGNGSYDHATAKSCAATVVSGLHILTDSSCVPSDNPERQELVTLRCKTPNGYYTSLGMVQFDKGSIINQDGLQIIRFPKDIETEITPLASKREREALLGRARCSANGPRAKASENFQISSDKKSITFGSSVDSEMKVNSIVNIYCLDSSNKEYYIGPYKKSGDKYALIKTEKEDWPKYLIDEDLAKLQEDIESLCTEAAQCESAVQSKDIPLAVNWLPILAAIEEPETSKREKSIQLLVYKAEVQELVNQCRSRKLAQKLEADRGEEEKEAEDITLESVGNSISRWWEHPIDNSVDGIAKGAIAGWEKTVSGVSAFGTDNKVRVTITELANENETLKEFLPEEKFDFIVSSVVEKMVEERDWDTRLTLTKRATYLFSQEIMKVNLTKYSSGRFLEPMTPQIANEFSKIINRVTLDLQVCLEKSNNNAELTECKNSFTETSPHRLGSELLNLNIVEKFSEFYNNNPIRLEALSAKAKEKMNICAEKWFFDGKHPVEDIKPCVYEGIFHAFNVTVKEVIPESLASLDLSPNDRDKLITLISDYYECGYSDYIKRIGALTSADYEKLATIDTEEFSNTLFECADILKTYGGEQAVREAVGNNESLKGMFGNQPELIKKITESVINNNFKPCLARQVEAKESIDANRCRPEITRGVVYLIFDEKLKSILTDPDIRNEYINSMLDAEYINGRSYIEELTRAQNAKDSVAEDQVVHDMTSKATWEVFNVALTRQMNEVFPIRNSSTVVLNSQEIVQNQNHRMTLTQLYLNPRIQGEIQNIRDQGDLEIFLDDMKISIAQDMASMSLNDNLGLLMEDGPMKSEIAGSMLGEFSKCLNQNYEVADLLIDNCIRNLKTISYPKVALWKMNEIIEDNFSDNLVEMEKVKLETKTNLNNCIADGLIINEMEFYEKHLQGCVAYSSYELVTQIGDRVATTYDGFLSNYISDAEYGDRSKYVQKNQEFKACINNVNSNLKNQNSEVLTDSLIKERLLQGDKVSMSIYIFQVEACAQSFETSIINQVKADFPKMNIPLKKKDDDEVLSSAIDILLTIKGADSEEGKPQTSTKDLEAQIYQISSSLIESCRYQEDKCREGIVNTKLNFCRYFKDECSKVRNDCSFTGGQCINHFTDVQNRLLADVHYDPKELASKLYSSEFMKQIIRSNVAMEIKDQLTEGITSTGYIDSDGKISGPIQDAINRISSADVLDKLFEKSEAQEIYALIETEIIKGNVDNISSIPAIKNKILELVLSDTEDGGFIEGLMQGVLQTELDSMKDTGGLKLAIGKIFNIVDTDFFTSGQIEEINTPEKNNEMRFFFSDQLLRPLIGDTDMTPEQNKSWQKSKEDLEQMVYKSLKNLNKLDDYKKRTERDLVRYLYERKIEVEMLGSRGRRPSESSQHRDFRRRKERRGRSAYQDVIEGRVTPEVFIRRLRDLKQRPVD